MGGLGKTTLANALFNQSLNTYKHVLWINISRGVKNSFADNIQLADSLNLNEEINKIKQKSGQITDEIFSLIFARLRDIKDPSLLVLDDADDSLDSLVQSFSLGDNWKILATSRIQLNNFYLYPLGLFTTEKAINLFFHYSGIKKTEDNIGVVKNIVTAVWNHTLTIELLAKTAFENNEFDIISLRKMLYDKGIKAVPDFDISTNYLQDKGVLNTIETTAFSCLKMAFTINEFNNDTYLKKILSNFSVLPPIPIKYENLKDLLEIEPDGYTVFHNTLNKLVKRSWLVKNLDSYQMHPVVQTAVREIIPPDIANCLNLIKTLSQRSKEFKSDNPVDLILYNSFIKSTLFFFENSANEVVSGLAYYYAVMLRNIGQPDSAELYHKLALDNIEKNNIESPLYPEILCGIAAVKISQNKDLDGAEKILNQVIEIYHKKGGSSQNIAIAHHNLAVIYKRKGTSDISFFSKAKDEIDLCLSLLKDLPDCKEEFATALVLNAQLLKKEGNLSEALNLLTQALTIRSSIYGQTHYTISSVYQDLAQVYFAIKDIDAAYNYSIKALNIDESFFEESSLNLAIPFHNHAALAYAKGDKIEAVKYQEKAVRVFLIHCSSTDSRLMAAQRKLLLYKQ